jgi:pimeloyl-ACP methyl ester carboxylesterase
LLFPTFFVDIRGYGHSRKIFGDYSIGKVAADAITLAEQLGWSEFRVVGRSVRERASSCCKAGSASSTNCEAARDDSLSQQAF